MPCECYPSAEPASDSKNLIEPTCGPPGLCGSLDARPAVRNGLHVLHTVLHGNLGECNSCRSAVSRRKHPREMHSRVAELQIQFVHRGRQLIAVPRFFKKHLRYLAVAQHVSHLHTHKEMPLMFLLIRSLPPDPL